MIENKNVIKPDYLNEREFKLLEIYLETGNMTQAAIEAGYSRRGASTAGSRIVNSDKGQKYLNKRYKELAGNDIKVAEKSEILEYLTAVMRGQEMDYDMKGNVRPPMLQERTKAAELLAKRLLDTEDTNTIKVQIIDDIPAGGADENV